MATAYEELVWRKLGEERCDWTPIQMPTEKKALTEQALAEQALAEEKKELEDPSIKNGTNFPKIGGVACGAGGDFPQMNLEPIHTRGLKSDTRKGGEEGHSQRYLVGQAIQNPFMPNSNYANDLEVQMNFLTPIKG